MLARQIKRGDECRSADGKELYWRAESDADVFATSDGAGDGSEVRCHVIYSDGGHGVRTWDRSGHIPDDNMWRDGANISGTRKLVG